jgi:hypothetical protein
MVAFLEGDNHNFSGGATVGNHAASVGQVKQDCFQRVVAQIMCVIHSTQELCCRKPALFSQVCQIGSPIMEQHVALIPLSSVSVKQFKSQTIC